MGEQRPALAGEREEEPMNTDGEYLHAPTELAPMTAHIDPDLICEWRFVATMIPTDMPNVLERAAAGLEASPHEAEHGTAATLRNYAEGLRRELARELTGMLGSNQLVVNADHIATVNPVDMRTASYTINVEFRR